jgi:hypothetical protein
MSFDRFLLAVESRDLFKTDKEYYESVLFFNFSKLKFLNDKIYSYNQKYSGQSAVFLVTTKKTIWHLAIWQN